MITKYWGENQAHNRGREREFVCYVRRDSNGFEIAVLNVDGEWEFDTVTEEWSPNSTFYQHSENVPDSEWPTGTAEETDHE